MNHAEITGGNLYVRRGPNMVEQCCPFSPETGIPCGEWCPHFGSPEPDPTFSHDYLTICQGRVFLIGERTNTDET